MTTRARKPRQPTTIEDALARAFELLGIDVAEQVTQRSRSALWAMSDPAKPDRPNDLVMLALDRALKSVGEPPVIRVTYGAIIDAHGEQRAPDETAERVTMALGKALGDLQGAVLEATGPDGPAGAAITPNEWARIGYFLHEIEGMRQLQPKDETQPQRLVPRAVPS